MPLNKTLEILFLRALPLDGAMWAKQMDLLPGHAHAPTLYELAVVRGTQPTKPPAEQTDAA